MAASADLQPPAASSSSSSSSSSSFTATLHSPLRTGISPFPELHRAAWKRDTLELSRLLRRLPNKEDINVRDARGNTALHIAAHFGYGDACFLLLKYGADPLYKNGGGFSVFQEAVAGGHPEVAFQLHFATQRRTASDIMARSASIHEALSNLPDFAIEIEWEFHSWVPLVSRFCPNDTYRISKKGTSIRMDYTLVGMEGISWIRADASLFFTGKDHARPGQMVSVNRTSKTVEWAIDALKFYDPEALRKEIASALHEPIQRSNTDPTDIVFEPATNWFGSEKFEQLGRFHCKLYQVLNCRIESTTRSEPSEFMTKTAFPIRQPKTPDQDITFDEYFDPAFVPSLPGKGTGMIWPKELVKRKSKAYTGQLWMTKTFPFTLEQFLPIIQALAPTSKHFARLHAFLASKLPDYGFPVAVDIPVFPTISAKVCFKNIDLEPHYDDAFFSTEFEYPTVVGSHANPEFSNT